jgi:hypothetical protein
VRLAPLVCFFLAITSASGQRITAGTYRLWVCANACTLADSMGAVAEALVVVVDDTVASAEATRTSFSQLPARIRWHAPIPTDNACFRVIRRSNRVGSEELFFGIVPIATSRVLLRPDGWISLPVYASPDAFFSLQWKGDGPLIQGEGWASGPFAEQPWHRNSYFVAIRIGDSDIRRCMPEHRPSD